MLMTITPLLPICAHGPGTVEVGEKASAVRTARYDAETNPGFHMKHRSPFTAFLAVLSAMVFLSVPPAASAQTGGTTPVVSVTATDPIAAENSDNTGTFTFVRVGDPTPGLFVSFEVKGTAGDGVDYESIASGRPFPTDPAEQRLLGYIRFEPGSTSVQVRILPLNDAAVEGTETVVLRLLPPLTASPIDGYQVGEPGEAVVKIEDDEPDPNQPPIVRLVMPSDGASFTAPANLLLVAQARDEDGEVKTVEFFAGDHSLGIRTNLPVANPLGPFVLPWNDVGVGEYRLTARATDDRGATTVSEPVRIIIRQESVVPVVNIEATDPEAGEIPVVPPWLGMPQRMDPGTFTVWRCGDTAAPLEVRYRIAGTARNGVDYMEIPNVVTIPAGSCYATIQIWPVDDGDVEGRETVVLTLESNDCDLTLPPVPGCYSVGPRKESTVYILDDDLKPNSPPVVRLLSPPEGAQFTAPAGMVITALARDEGGWVEKVEFFAGDRSLGPVESPVPGFGDRYHVNWSDVPAGEYILTAKATDNFGATRVSEPVHVVVRGSELAPLVLIPKGSVWKFLDTGSDQGTAWREPGFDDENWGSGPGQLGFGDGDEATVLNPGLPDHRNITYYFRREFAAPGSGTVLNLVLRLLRDDGAIVYLNGTEVFRSNLPDGLITFQTLALSSVNGDAEHAYYSAPVDPTFLKNAGNVVAVEIHQVVASSADLSFDLELLANVPPPPNQPPSVTIVTPQNGAVFFAPAAVIIRAEAADRDGTVKKVEFYAGDRLIGTDETAPFGLTWEPVPAGEYVLTAKATDDDGASASSDGTRILVKLPPPEPATVNVEATDPEAAEISPLLDVMPNTAVFTVTRSGGTNIALAVYYEVGGVALNDVDYERLSGQVVIPEGAWSATIVVSAIDDSLFEGPESVVVELRWPFCPAIYPPPPECYRVGEHGRAEARILDNDEPPGNLPPMIRITQPLAGSVFRAPADVNITALVRDLDGWVGLVEFFANERKIGEQRIFFIQAPPPGELQTFGLDWSQVPTGDYSLVAMATDDRGAVGKSEPVKIRVVEATPPPPVVTVHARDGLAREGTNSAGSSDTATFVVRRNDGTNAALTVFYSLRGAAENGADYTSLSGSVTIAEGRRSARVVVSPIDDTLRERVETVVIKLEPDPTMGPIARYTIGRPGRAAAVILDNDVRLPHCQWLADGLFQFCFPGDDGACFRMEYSTDLVNWTSVDTGVVADGAIHFVDPEATVQSSRFYRLAPEIYVDLDE